MKNIAFNALLCLLALFVSCKKSGLPEETTYLIKVKEHKTNEPLAGVKISMYRCSNYDPVFGCRANRCLQLLLLLFTCSIFSQEVIKNSEYYSAKSKKQETGARVMLIGGAVLIGTGFLIGDRAESSFDDAANGAILGGLGVLLMLGSIPVFIASSKNKRKAAAPLSFNNMMTPQIKNSSMVYKPIAAVSLKINL